MDLNALNQKFNAAKGLSFAAIRLPGTADIYFFYASAQPELSKLTLAHSDKPVFVCSPYGAGNLAYQFNADVIYKNEDVLYGDVQMLKPHLESQSTFNENKYASKEQFCKYVEDGIKEIKKDKLDKVVTARCEKIKLTEAFQRVTFFHTLCNQYPESCVYYFAIEEGTPWMGATPEKLMQVEQGQLTTVALAGTLPADTAQEWTQKERDEQHITSDFIRQVFDQMKLKPLKESPVTTIQAGKLQHLSSTFIWRAPEVELVAKFHKLLNELNPTPAVCGMPQFGASSFIALNENLERRFYSGFVGILQGTKATSLFVNLRCMELGTQEALLYAGAGITADSNPELEWEETSRKMGTLRSLID